MEKQENEEFYDSQEEYFLDCCRAGDLEEVREVLKEQGLDMGWTNQDQNNCLHMVAANGHQQVLKELLAHLTTKPAVLTTLLNHQNADGNTPLHYATICGHKNVVQALLAAGADPNIHNECNRSAFKEAELLNKLDIAQVLAKVTKVELEELKEEDLVEPEAANQRVDEEEETDGVVEEKVEEEEEEVKEVKESKDSK